MSVHETFSTIITVIMSPVIMLSDMIHKMLSNEKFLITMIIFVQLFALILLKSFFQCEYVGFSVLFICLLLQL